MPASGARFPAKIRVAIDGSVSGRGFGLLCVFENRQQFMVVLSRTHTPSKGGRMGSTISDNTVQLPFNSLVPLSHREAEEGSEMEFRRC